MSASPRQVNVNEQHEQSLNVLDRVALAITTGVGSMYCAFIFAALALVALPSAIDGGPLTIVQWISQTFLQLVLLSVIMVGQNLQGRHSEFRAENDYQVNLIAEQEVKALLQNIQTIDQRTLAIVQHLHLVETAKDPP